MKVTIVGAGNMGRGIGSRVVAGGNEVELVDRNPEDSQSLAEELGQLATVSQSVSGEVVVLALPTTRFERRSPSTATGLRGGSSSTSSTRSTGRRWRR